MKNLFRIISIISIVIVSASYGFSTLDGKNYQFATFNKWLKDMDKKPE